MTVRALDFSVPYVRPTWGNANAPIVVVCDAATPEAYEQGRALALKYHQHFALVAKEFGFSRDDFLFVGLCPPVPRQDVRSAFRRWAHVEPHVEAVREIIARHDPRMVVTFGELATRAVLGRAVKITKVRGVAVVREDGPPVYPMLSPGFVAKVPDHASTFRADVSTLSRIRDAEWDVAAISSTESNYEWCTDISAYLGENKPSVITLDTETANRRPGGNALRWWDPDTYVLTVQFSTGPGHAVVCPVDEAYWGKFEPGERNRLVGQLRELLEDPRVRKIGQNIKYDHLMSRCLEIEVQGWLHDTMLMAFAVDENMMSLGQDDLTRVYAPEMSGYCVVPDTKILKDDLTKIRADEVRVGDRLVGFDEHANGKSTRRRMRYAEVSEVLWTNKPCVRLKTATGRVIVVSHDHKMLAKRSTTDAGGGWRWVAAEDLNPGMVLKPFPWADCGASYMHGYMAAMFDGEGYITNAGKTGLRAGISQAEGPVLDKTLRLWRATGGNPAVSRTPGKVANATVATWGAIESLMCYRPVRLLNKLDLEGRCLPNQTGSSAFDEIVSVRNVGRKDVVMLRTSTHTFIANGLCSHNSDQFNRTYDKALMHLVPHDDMLTYAGGDPDACFRIAQALKSRLSRDSRQQNIYRRIQLPAILSFANMTEPYGLLVDKDKLREFCDAVESWLDEEYQALIRLVPPAVRRKHLNSGKGLVFSRPDFVRDVLFSRGGFGLAPVAYTDSTKDLEDKSLRMPSTSTKHHMPYFVNDPRVIGDTGVTVGDFVTRLIEFQKTTKMSSTYLGHEAVEAQEATPDQEAIEAQDASGIWQYMSPEGRVHPSYGVSFTDTGRTNSRDPNGQNFPKRGSRWAKLYQQIFVPTPGYKFVAADLSQVELRVAAEMAQEPTMLRIFREGGDIHVMTAAFVLGLPYEQVAAWKGDKTLLLDVANDVPGSGDFLRKLNPGARSKATLGDYFNQKRYEAKSVGFGFLFGMGWRKFRVYAKTEYGLDYTEEEAQALRTAFFARYPGLVTWHETMKEFAWQHGYVRALHGACRHLPSVYSEDEAIAAAAGRYAINSPVQRLGSDLGLIAKIRFSHQVDPDVIRDLAFVHDQLILEVKEGHEEEAAKALKWCMENPPLEEWFGITMSVPIIAEVEIGDNGGSLEEQKGMEAAKPSWWDDDEEAAAARFYARRRPAGEAVRLAA